MKSYYAGVDVGTKDVRVALFNDEGLYGIATQHIEINETSDGHYEQSSDNIWETVCQTLKWVMTEAEVTQLAGISFDATCSMVVLQEDGKPITVSKSGVDKWNVILWMDHRAEAQVRQVWISVDCVNFQATRINATNHPGLQHLGGSISPEMQIPKLLWIKEELPNTWRRAKQFMDLCDFLTYKCSGSFSRSRNALTCKWNYISRPRGEVSGFDRDFYNAAGLHECSLEEFARIGTEVQDPGDPCGTGVTSEASEAMGVLMGTPVGTGVVDAYAGALGCIASMPSSLQCSNQSQVFIVAGTSTCILITSDSPSHVAGVWGPYHNVMLSPQWVLEGGQSATGKLLDHMIDSLREDAAKSGNHVDKVLTKLLDEMAKEQGLCHATLLTADLHVYPDYHGNRSPLADSTMKGAICGLTLSTSRTDLALQYLATIQSFAYSTRFVLASMREAGHVINQLHVCGGLSNSNLYIQTLADATGCKLIISSSDNVITLGSAVLAAKASDAYYTAEAAMEALGCMPTTCSPTDSMNSFHNKKYAVFRRMLADQKHYRTMMSN